MGIDLNLVGLALAAVALCDRRSWPFVILIGSVWIATASLENAPDRLTGLALRIPIDFCAGIIAATMSKSITGKGVSALFVLMLLNHSMFWLARFNGLDIWLTYANSVNGLWLAQWAILAFPGGKVIGRNLSRLGRLFLNWCRGAGMGDREAQPAHRNSETSGSIRYRRVNVGQRGGVHLSEEA